MSIQVMGIIESSRSLGKLRKQIPTAMTPFSPSIDRFPRVRRLAVTAVFFLVGSVSGTWAARIPAIKADLHLSAGILGLPFLGPAVGE